jgi:hypothetical protein
MAEQSFNFNGFIEYLQSLLKLKYNFDTNQNFENVGYIEIKTAEKCVEILERTLYDNSSSEDDLEMDDDSIDGDFGSDYCAEEFEGEIKQDGVNYEYMQKVVDYMREHPTHTYPTIENKFRRLKGKYQLQRWYKYVVQNGTKFQKYQRVAEYVLDQFTICRELLYPIRDIDLIRWGKKCAREIGLSSFKVSYKKITYVDFFKLVCFLFYFKG